jgi:hypothetical protein
MFIVYYSIYELERLAQVPHKFQFPLFETFHWYAAKTFYEELKGKILFLIFIFLIEFL